MERSVDLPQPEGPAMETYSPCLISMWMPERAWVSTSSVRKTLVTASSLMSNSDMGGMRLEGRKTIQRPSAVSVATNATMRARSKAGTSMTVEPLEQAKSFRKSVQFNPVIRVPLRHVGEDDFVAGHEAADDFDGIDGAAAEFDLRAHRVIAVGVELEDTDLALLLAERGPPDVNDVVEPLELNGAIDGKIGACALRQLGGDEHVDGDGAVLHGGIDPADADGDDTVARVDLGGLANEDVLRLRLRHAHLGLEFRRVGDAREIGARSEERRVGN